MLKTKKRITLSISPICFNSQKEKLSDSRLQGGWLAGFFFFFFFRYRAGPLVGLN
jgi:hypothetical protein